MVQILRNRTEIEEELIFDSDSEEAISSDSESELDENNMVVGYSNNETGS